MTGFLSELRPASFRGVSFLVASNDEWYARRLARHEFPGRDGAFHEDMGQAPDSFSIEAVCCGASYRTTATALAAAIKTAGPGQLVHPLYGLTNVVALDGRSRHTTERGGEIVFNINFERYYPPAFPYVQVDTAAGVLLDATNFMNIVSDGFSGVFSVLGLPDYIGGDAGSVLNGLKSLFISSLDRYGLGWLADLLEWSDGLGSKDVAGTAGRVLGAMQRSTSPAVKPQLSGLLPAASAPAASAAAVADAMLAVANEIPGPTFGTARRQVNADQMNTLMRVSAVSSAAAATAQTDFVSRESALVRRQELTGAIDALREDLAGLGQDSGWRAATALKSAVMRDINERLGRLPRTVRVSPGWCAPSLAIAHRLYGEADVFGKADDLVRRNAVRHPGFMPSRALEVLVDA